MRGGLVTLEEVRAAAERLRPVLRVTPVSEVPSLCRLSGVRVLLKEEHRQRTGSFKVRGAYHRLAGLGAGAGVVAASAGNHAQGVALAAQLLDLAATIFTPEAASLPKVAATRDYGATVVPVAGGLDAAVAAARGYADDHGAVFVPPFDDPAVIAGQGTVALEVLDQVPELAGGGTVVVPVGGGGLLAGVGTVLAARAPAARLIGVEASGAASMAASLAAGEVRGLGAMATIADGIAVRAPSPLTLAHAQAFAHEMVAVTDEQIGEAIIALLERAKAVVEPAGAASLAAVLAGAVRGPEPVVVVLSGGNVDSLLLSRLIEHGLSVGGRFLRLRIDIPDRPGSLAAVTTALADMGLNVLDVAHHREGLPKLDVGEVELAVTVETRGPGHRDDCLAVLRARGWNAQVDQ